MISGERYRTFNKLWQILFLALTTVGILLAIHQVMHLQTITGITLVDNRYLYLILAIFLSLVFILKPATKRAAKTRVPWYDIALFIFTLVVGGYFAWHGLDITRQGWEVNAPALPTALGVILWLLVLEGVRRAGGTAMFVVVLVMSLYPLYAGYMPRLISGFSISFLDAARYHAMSVESIMGIPMRVVGTIFLGFIIMGVALVVTGGGQFFINLSSALLGNYRGGPAKVSIVASGLFGSMSGSVISNILATGSFTIPAMKRIGYPPRYAAAIEACASTGGVLMPPIMGAVAFVMASFLAIPYWQVALAAAIPSVLYYFSLFLQIDAYAALVGMKGLPREELPSIKQTLKEGWFYIVVFALLVWLLLYMRREAPAPFYATGLLFILVSFRKETRMNYRRLLEFIGSVGRVLAELTAQLGAVGLIIGSLSVTGMVITFSTDLVNIAGGSIPGLLIMGALTSFVLGMGMSVTACYVFLAIVLAPALVAGGLNPLAIHLFVVYWGMLSYITPPVAVGAYVAASIAESHPMRTGVESMRLGGAQYFLPFFFVLNPMLVLQELTLTGFLLAISTAMLAILLISAGLQGHLLGVGHLRKGLIGWLTRLLLIIGGLLIGWPGIGTSIVGALIAAPVILGYMVINRRAAHPTYR